jgi:hypothetical protein
MRKEEMHMKLIQLVGAASAIGTISLALVGTASADATLGGTTGPNSTQKVVTTATYSSTTNNANVISIINDNSQSAWSGGASAKDNTTVGNVGSGSASNVNTTNPTIAIENAAPGQPGIGAGNGASGGQGGSVGGQTGSSKPAAKPGQGGSVLGVSTVAGNAAILPVTGPIDPVDVSALRAAWHRHVLPGPSGLEKSASFFTAGMLITATLLSLIGAAGSAIYMRRQERRV